MLLKCFLRVLLYQKQIQVNFHCVMSSGSENSVKNGQFVYWKYPRTNYLIKSHQQIIMNFTIQEYQTSLKFSRKIPLIRSTNM